MKPHLSCKTRSPTIFIDFMLLGGRGCKGKSLRGFAFEILMKATLGDFQGQVTSSGSPELLHEHLCPWNFCAWKKSDRGSTARSKREAPDQQEKKDSSLVNLMLTRQLLTASAPVNVRQQPQGKCEIDLLSGVPPNCEPEHTGDHYLQKLRLREWLTL